jgi:hypothetical protein
MKRFEKWGSYRSVRSVRLFIITLAFFQQVVAEPFFLTAVKAIVGSLLTINLGIMVVSLWVNIVFALTAQQVKVIKATPANLIAIFVASKVALFIVEVVALVALEISSSSHRSFVKLVQ